MKYLSSSYSSLKVIPIVHEFIIQRVPINMDQLDYKINALRGFVPASQAKVDYLKIVAELPCLLGLTVSKLTYWSSIRTEATWIVQGTFSQRTYGSTELRSTDIGCNRYTKKCLSHGEGVHKSLSRIKTIRLG